MSKWTHPLQFSLAPSTNSVFALLSLHLLYKYRVAFMAFQSKASKKSCSCTNSARPNMSTNASTSVNSMDCWVVSDSCWVAERLLNGCPTVVVVVRFGFVIKGSQFRCCHLVKIGTESLSLLQVLYSALPRWQTFSWLLPDGYHGYPQTLGVSGPYRSISDVSDFSQMSLM